jgi:hypothetical protein
VLSLGEFWNDLRIRGYDAGWTASRETIVPAFQRMMYEVWPDA